MFEPTLPDPDTMYRALVEKDSSFEGIFFAGVTTTGIFCRPTCTARKPNRENVVYFPTTREALLAGYRPCRVCHPMTLPGTMPDAVARLLQEIEANPGLRLTDTDLQTRGIEPAGLRRLFKRTHGMTFQGYLRARRVGEAFGQIKHGESATDAAFGHGWESLSGFGEAFRRIMGASPSRATGPVTTVTRIETPLGPMLAGASDVGVALLEFADRRMLETQIERLSRLLGTPLVPGSSPFFGRLAEELRRYFAGELRRFEVPLDLRGTPFQTRVWTILLGIPYGTTRSYSEQAQAVGDPAAIRAVARANGDNRIAVIVPCHRVVGSDGSLTGYGGGLWRKQWLLDLERRQTGRR